MSKEELTMEIDLSIITTPRTCVICGRKFFIVGDTDFNDKYCLDCFKEQLVLVPFKEIKKENSDIPKPNVDRGMAIYHAYHYAKKSRKGPNCPAFWQLLRKIDREFWNRVYDIIRVSIESDIEDEKFPEDEEDSNFGMID